MELIEAIQQIAKVYTERKDKILTEEATKNALIMPFISALGYNVFDPFEVVPEFTAEFGAGNGKKVDYAIIKDGNPIMLIEAKWCGASLDVSKEAQLLYYFNATPSVTVGILTNGVEYRLYTDLDKENVMDQKPFLQFSITNITDHILKELKKFAKSTFNTDEIVSTAEELRYTGAMKAHLSEQLAEPSEDFVRYMTKQVFGGIITEKIRDKFKNITKKAFAQFISDRVSDRLSSALSEEKAMLAPADNINIVNTENTANKVETTQEEIDAYNIVKSILRKHVDLKRVVMRDVLSYCGILFDDSNRNPICRFYFDTANKYIALFNEEKKEKKVLISCLDDIYNYADALISTVESYLKPKDKKETDPAQPTELV